MICYPGKEFVEKYETYIPYVNYDLDGRMYFDDATPKNAKKAYEWCQEFIRKHPNYFND